MQVCPSGLSTTLPPPSTILWKEVAEPTPHPRRGRCPALRTGLLQSHVEPPGFLVSFSVTCLCQVGPMGIYLFYASGRDPVRLCSVAEPAPALALGSSSAGSAVPLTYPSVAAAVVCFQALPSLSHFLLLSESQCSSREPGPFCWKWHKRPRFGR